MDAEHNEPSRVPRRSLSARNSARGVMSARVGWLVAVSGCVFVVLVLGGWALASGNASWGTAMKVSLPPGAQSVGDFGRVSCASAGNCSAVGTYVDSSGDTRNAQGLLLNESAGVWARGVKAALPADAGSNSGVGLLSLSCASAGNCSAVGYYRDSSGKEQNLLLGESAGVWGTGVKAALPADASSSAPDAGLTSVSCASAGNCSAIGTYRDSSDNTQGLLVSESSGVWATPVEAPLPADAGSDAGFGSLSQVVELSSVSCASAGNCSAVGGYVDSSGGTQGLLLSESSGVWSRGVKAALPADASSVNQVVRLSVSCASAGNCSAVGSYLDSSLRPRGLLLSENSGSWGRGVEAALPADAGSNSGGGLTSVSCASAGNCSAIGEYQDSSGNLQGLLLRESSGSWATGVKAALPPDARSNPGVHLYSVSCGSAGNCSGGGTYQDRADHRQGLLLSESSGSWATGVKASLPADATRASDPGVLLWVSCPPAGDCTAVGSYIASSARQGFLLGSTSASPTPTLSKLRVSPKRFSLTGRKVHGRCVNQTTQNMGHKPCRRPLELNVSYALNATATVTFTIKREAPGRKVKGRCVNPSSQNRTKPRCRRLVEVNGKITHASTNGPNSFTITGTIGGHKLGAGAYELVATPNGGKPTTATFKLQR